MKQRILLIEPSYIDLYGKSKIATKPYFPLGLGYIAAVLKRAGHECRIQVHTGQQGYLQKIQTTILDFKPTLIGLTAMTTNYPNAVAISKEIKKCHQIPIVIGGIHVSARKEKILIEQNEIDYVVFGEGEDTVVDLVDTISKCNNDFSMINGLVWRKDGRVIVNPERRLNSTLDTIPFPARELVDISEFSTHSHIYGGRSATILTSRGCPYHCVFCAAHKVHGHMYREHSVDYVLTEIEVLVRAYNVKYIFIQDDTFTVNRKRVVHICNGIIEKKLDVHFGCFSRVDIMDIEMANLLKKAGCVNVVFGIESGDEDTLKKMKKHSSLAQARKAVKACEAVGLKTLASFVIGFPFDTVKTMQKTIEFSMELNPTLVAFNPLVPFPGSEIFDDAVHNPLRLEDWNRYITVDVPPFSFVSGLSPHDIYRIAQQGNRAFYLRPGQLFRIMKSIRGFSDVIEYLKAGIAVLGR